MDKTLLPDKMMRRFPVTGIISASISLATDEAIDLFDVLHWRAHIASARMSIAIMVPISYLTLVPLQISICPYSVNLSKSRLTLLESLLYCYILSWLLLYMQLLCLLKIERFPTYTMKMYSHIGMQKNSLCREALFWQDKSPASHSGSLLGSLSESLLGSLSGSFFRFVLCQKFKICRDS